MFRPTSRLAIAASAILAATVIAACGSNSHNSGLSSASAGQPSVAQMLQDGVNFSRCMRSHGVSTFPDPTTSPRAFKHALDPSIKRAPTFISAMNACQHLLPEGGPPSGNSSHSQAHVAAMLAFARCIRSHGFPHFPDPTNTGQVTHQMIASAGIDIHQPAVVRAADACVGATHGFITRGAVARFIAGH
jgi:hypothetical protein